MKTALVFYSTHHGNTRKLMEAIAARDEDLVLIDITADKIADLSGYDRVGFASGIYFSKYGKDLIEFAEKHLPREKDVFFMHTGGSPREKQNAAIKLVTDAKGCRCLGTFCCKGFDTFGPFKLFGGIAKGHPDENDIANAVKFYQNLGK